MTPKAILVSGGEGRLARALCLQGTEAGHRMICPSKTRMNVRERDCVQQAIRENCPDVFIHCAAEVNTVRQQEAIETNIIGTANVVLACLDHRVKLVYVSTDYVYDARDAHHVETDALLPATPYAWTKLGGECSVRLCENALIVRGAFCPSPYPHAQAYTDVEKNCIYQDKAARLILRLLEASGVVNVAEAEQESLFAFASRTRPDVQPALSPADYQPKRSYLAIDSLERLLQVP